MTVTTQHNEPSNPPSPRLEGWQRHRALLQSQRQEGDTHPPAAGAGAGRGTWGGSYSVCSPRINNHCRSCLKHLRRLREYSRWLSGVVGPVTPRCRRGCERQPWPVHKSQKRVRRLSVRGERALARPFREGHRKYYAERCCVEMGPLVTMGIFFCFKCT